MTPITHVFYDQMKDRMVLFRSLNESKYVFIFENEELVMDFKEISLVEGRELYIYLGSVS